jgi:hypothetical protein
MKRAFLLEYYKGLEGSSPKRGRIKESYKEPPRMATGLG